MSRRLSPEISRSARFHQLRPGTMTRSATRLVPESERFRRPTIERELLSALHAHRVIQIVGEMGVGKTILLATVASDQSWVFVSGRGRTPTELAQRLCARLATELGETTVPRLTYDAATGDAAALLDRIGPRTLAIDDCPSPDFVEDLLKGSREPHSQHLDPLRSSTGGRNSVPSLSRTAACLGRDRCRLEGAVRHDTV